MNDELNDELDLNGVRSMLEEVGYDEDRLTEQGGQSRLVAYYVASKEINDADLHRHLSKRLPSDWIPSQFIELDTIPLTVNGKVETDALPPPGLTPDSHLDEFVEPEGPVQEQISKIWQSVLGTERVSAGESFFQFGGTSLAAMEVMLKICNHFEIDLPLQTVFQNKTITALAEVVEAKLFEEISGLSDEEAERLVVEHYEEKG